MKGFLAWFLRSVLRYRSDVVTVNLSRSFPEKTYDELKAIHKRFYRHLATIFTETLWFSRCRGDKGRKRLRDSHIVEFTNPEEFNRLYGGAHQLMLLQAHTGNWELIGGILNYSYGTPLDFTAKDIAVTYLRLHNPRMDRRMARYRTAAVADQGFDGYLEAGEVLRFALKNRDRKFVYVFITDQYPYNSHDNIRVDFLHQQTPTMTGAAALAAKLDMAVGYLRFEAREEGGYRMTVVPISDHAAGENPVELMQRYYRLLEEDIQKQPWNYLWTHKRWK